MLKTESLIKLINNLSKQEKKEFSIYISGKPQKDYMIIFNLINENRINEINELKRQFTKERPNSSFNSSASYLYKLLIEILTRLRREQDSYYLLFNQILHAKVLHEKSMYEECFHQLKEIKQKAVYTENHFALLVAQRLELNYLLASNFVNLEEKLLINKQYQMKNTLKIINKLNEQSSLYELLKYRMITNGASRSIEDVYQLNDLVTSEISIVASNNIENFEINKNHQLFQANYLITVGDYKAAYLSFLELNKLFEENKHLWNNPPIYYLMTIVGVLDSLRFMKNYDGINYFISKLENLSSNFTSFRLLVTFEIFKYRLCSYIDNGDFCNAIAWINDNKNTLIDHMMLLPQQQQGEISLYSALAFLGYKDYKSARKWIAPLIRHEHLYPIPLFRTIRIVNLMVHYELEDVDYIHSEIRSIKRAISKHKKLKVESFLLKFLKIPINEYPQKKRIEIWDSMKDEAKRLYNDKFETQILHEFDFCAWVESKILNISLANLLVKKISNKDLG